MCLVTRYRYDNKLPQLALDARLIQYAQTRAEYLSQEKFTIKDNAVDGDAEPIHFESKYWTDVKENMLSSEQNPTFAYWDIQDNEAAAKNLADKDVAYFGVGYYEGYYVQTFGYPKDKSLDSSLVPWCTSNETFYNWVFPQGTAKEDADQGKIQGTAFPYESYADSSVFYDDSNPDFDNGLVKSPIFYFTPDEGSVPYLQNLSITTTVADGKDDNPFSAIADAGVQGLTKEELNLVVCLVNAQRYQSCLPPLALNSQLIAAAQAHSYEMNRVHNMSHYSSAGDISMRLKRRGFSFSSAGENVAYGVHDAYSMYVMFAESQMHLDNILNPDFTFVGSGRSGQYWTMSFGTYSDKDARPDQATLPLCPGNDTDIMIAFPSGLPEEPKLETSACGNTEATSVAPPPYIQSASQEDPSESNSESDSSSESDVESDSGLDNFSTEISDNDVPTDPPEETDDGSVIVSGYVNYVVVTETVICTVYVDGDALIADAYDGSDSSEDCEDTDYSATSLDDGELNVILTPNYVEI
ncbi:hypothetical protein H4R20_001103 [Coemansia guatemalensis]|uniref:SCP domain-containing protein n=1 Tax=Coemansia guatemalensis TaxID=2761395 RepID=A0A9W8LVZ2_9FUNG|nr:hypothetical protein H4R20_001103 [Coemansia guatemalensis]